MEIRPTNTGEVLLNMLPDPNLPGITKKFLLLKYSYIPDNNAFVLEGMIKHYDSNNRHLHNISINDRYEKFIGDNSILVNVDPNHPEFKQVINVRGETLYDVINRLNPPPPAPRPLYKDEVPDAAWLAEKQTYDDFVQWTDLPFDYKRQWTIISEHNETYVIPLIQDFLLNLK